MQSIKNLLIPLYHINKFKFFKIALMLALSACTNQVQQERLTKLTEDEVIEKLFTIKSLEEKNFIIKSTDGVILSIDSVSKLYDDEYTMDIYKDDKGELVEGILRKATEKDIAFKEKIKQSINKGNLFKQEANSIPKINIDCSKQTEFLSQIYHLDQDMRLNGSIDPVVDRSNLTFVLNIIHACGMPTVEEVGEEGMTTVFLVLQHADHENRKAYFPLLKKAAENGDLKSSQIAMMEDRLLMHEGEPQRYGTQVRMESGKDYYELYTLENAESVDERRASIGLGPLKDYVKRWDIIFDVKQVACN